MYRVKDWDKHYENDRSRQRDQCSFVCVPNKQHGSGFIRLMGLPNGMEIYGVFNAILGACSRQRRPRLGYLTDDGTPDSYAWMPKDLSEMWRTPEAVIENALNVLSSDRIGWLEKITADSPSSNRQVHRREGKGIEGKEDLAAQGSSEPQAASEPPHPPIMVFPTVGPVKEWPLTLRDVSCLRDGFPHTDVVSECRKALVWVKCSPRRAKTARGMMKFLFGWMERAQNNRGSFHEPKPDQQFRGSKREIPDARKRGIGSVEAGGGAIAGDSGRTTASNNGVSEVPHGNTGRN